MKRPAKMPPDADARRRELYDQGLSDAVIATRGGVSAEAVRLWRKARDLPPNFAPGDGGRRKPGVTPIDAEMRDVCLRLVRRGLAPSIITKGLGVSRNVIEKYRAAAVREGSAIAKPIRAPMHAPRFPSGRRCSAFRPDRRRAAFVLYARGASDHEIAASIAATRQQVREWRARFALPANALKRAARPVRRPPPAPITPRTNGLYAQVADAIGRVMPPDMADDAISDLVLAVLEGRVQLDQVQREARSFRARVWKEYADRRNRSIDEELGDGDGFRLVDMLRDDRSSDWLERSGASAW